MRKITVEQLKSYYPTMQWVNDYSDSKLESLYSEVYQENIEDSYTIIFENRRIANKYEIFQSFLDDDERKGYSKYFFKEIEKEFENEIVERIKMFSRKDRKDIKKFVNWIIQIKKVSIDRVCTKVKLEIDKCINKETKECLTEIVSELCKKEE